MRSSEASGSPAKVRKAGRWKGDIRFSQVIPNGPSRAWQSWGWGKESKLRASDNRHCGVCGPFRQKVGTRMGSQ